MLPTTKFAHRKSLGICNALICVAHTLLSALEMGREARMFQIDFIAAFDWATIRGFSSSFAVWEFGDSVLSVLTVSI